MRIDSHQHFWNYSAAEYPWIGAGMERLACDHLPADLETVARPVGVVGSVAVQARRGAAHACVRGHACTLLLVEHEFERRARSHGGIVGAQDILGHFNVRGGSGAGRA